MGPGRENVVKKEYIFDPNIPQGYPSNFQQVTGLDQNSDMKDKNNLKIGVTCYENFFTDQELNEIEKLVEKTE